MHRTMSLGKKARILLACSIKVCGREQKPKRKATILDILEVWQAAAFKICYPNFSIQRTSKCECHLRQPCSSLPSLQSGIPSHLYVSCMHCFRSEHLNCVAKQVIGGQPSSSWLSKQSLSPSHTQDWGMQCPDRGHVNCSRNNIILYHLHFSNIFYKINHILALVHK